jgi:hypothetical protein
VIGRDVGADLRIRDIPLNLRAELIGTLTEFADLHITRALEEREHVHAVAGLVELRRIYSGLAHVYPEFEANVRAMDAGLDRLHIAARSQLMQAYVRSRDPAEIDSISETLGRIISKGGWDWEREFDAAVEAGNVRASSS